MKKLNVDKVNNLSKFECKFKKDDYIESIN
jgi:hypothetical protein